MIKVGHVNLFILLSKRELQVKSKWPTGNSVWSSEPADCHHAVSACAQHGAEFTPVVCAFWWLVVRNLQ